MSEITWIKILTSIRRNKKILLIKAMPEGDALFCIWIDLICMAGEINERGVIYITPGVPYTDEELGTVLNRTPAIIRLAINTFIHYNMASINEDGFIILDSFEEIQNIEGMERVRLLGAERSQRYRDKQLQLKEGNVTITSRDATDKIRLDKRREEEKRREEDRIKNEKRQLKFKRQKYGHVVKH